MKSLISLPWFQKTPAESREHNRDCILLSFFDDHDVWHFLSSIAMFGSFLVCSGLKRTRFRHRRRPAELSPLRRSFRSSSPWMTTSTPSRETKSLSSRVRPCVSNGRRASSLPYHLLPVHSKHSQPGVFFRQAFDSRNLESPEGCQPRSSSTDTHTHTRANQEPIKR